MVSQWLVRLQVRLGGLSVLCGKGFSSCTSKRDLRPQRTQRDAQLPPRTPDL